MKKIKFSVLAISTFLVLGLCGTANANGIGHNKVQVTKVTSYRNNTKIIHNNPRNNHEYGNARNTKVVKRVIVVEQKPRVYPRNVIIERRQPPVRSGIEVKINLPIFR